MKQKIQINTGSELLRFLVPLGVVLIFVSICVGGFHLLDTKLMLLVPSTAIGIVLGSVFLVLGLWRSGSWKVKYSDVLLACCVGLVLLSLSDVPHRRFNFFHSPYVRFELLVAGLIWILVARRWSVALSHGVLIVTVITAIACFFFESGGRLLFSDDHPAFYYRLLQLKERFPSIPFYNPLWNGGVDAREFFPSGVLNLYFLSLPFIAFLENKIVYNLIVSYVLFLLVPLFTYVAARSSRATTFTAAIAATLALAPSLYWYRWALTYGTMGFIVSSALIPLNTVLAAKILDASEQISGRQALLFFCSLSLMLLWSPALLIWIPIGLWGLLTLRRCWKKKYVALLLAGLLLVNIPWMLLFVRASNVLAFVQHTSQDSEVEASSENPHESASTIPSTAVKTKKSLWDPMHTFARIRELAGVSNPLLLMLGLPGIVLLRSFALKLSFFLTSFWLLLLGLVGAELKPQLELDRMLLVFFHFLAIPAAFSITELFSLKEQNLTLWKQRLLQLGLFVVGGLFIITPVRLWRIVSNKTSEHFTFASDTVNALSEAIQKYSEDGRTLIAGFILHELDGGHVAPLPYFTKKPIVASSYQHNRWEYTDIVPPEYRARKDAGVREYLDLYNVSSIVTHDKFWRDWYLRRPLEYEKVWSKGRFHLFRRKNFVSNYFIEGQGQLISQETSQVRLRLEGGSAVLKFNYYPFVEAGSCTLTPRNISKSVVFIELSRCAYKEEISLKAKPPFTRILAPSYGFKGP